MEEGQTVSVTAKDASNNTSAPTTATVGKADDKTAPAAPVVNPVKAGDTAVTGTAEAGSTVEVTLPDGTKASATADQDGNYSVPVSSLEEGQTVSVTAKDASNNTSTPTTATVGKADDKTAPAAPVVNPVKAGDTAVTGTAEAGSTVEVTLPDGTKASATADQDGNFSVPVSGLEEGQTVSVTAKDASNNTSTPTTATVGKADDKTAPAAPVVNPVKAGDTAITGTAEAGSTVEVTLSDGTKASAKADKDGNFSVPVSGLEEGQTVSVTAKDASNNTSTPTTATVGKADDKTAPAAPVVNPVKAGDTAITGTAEAGSTVEVTLSDGTKASAKADKDGKFSIPVSGLNAGDTVSVTTTDEAGNTSATTTVTVSKVNVGGKDADNAKVPVLTPVVDPSNLTDAEKAKVAEEVKKANPTATDVKVNNDGSVVVTFADGSVATIAANKVVKEATKESSAQAPAKKAGAKELPNTGTKQSNASLGLALLAAVTGGLLISKKRKEEE
ncbi:Cell wall-associated protease [Streptococcus infantis]|uniref:Cell wall-associated protease n=1 Tax=Streptococcus infantis TaxID=68892 RepID=A0A0F3H0T3_9STRE|nr:Cell wall-associated protease [Streptococcus infantis]